ncbi:MAG: glucosamine-6-phosphate deaminase [Candidatus Promineifilaceae bacterium]|nr:glucosamine-6-phosphate deaminase [Candidatus Promineifilaceae bacterium]
MTIEPMKITEVGMLPVTVYRSNEDMGEAAAAAAAEIIKAVVAAKGAANIIIATGNSQLTFLQSLRQTEGIDWSKVTIFHMDEYIDLPPGHPASFPTFLERHLLDHIPEPAAFYPVRARAGQLEKDCADYAGLLRQHPADLCAMGIGENGHIAFNDPPYAEFEDPVWVKVVRLDEISRKQQVGEGHFNSLEEVPTHAITLTIPALLAADKVLCIVPEARKAEAVYQALHGPVTESCPASILRKTGNVHLYLDPEAAAKGLPK